MEKLAELGYNPKHITRLQVNLALIVSKFDKYPISHFICNGSRNSLSTIRNLITQLKDTDIESGTIIWDRGNVSKEQALSFRGDCSKIANILKNLILLYLFGGIAQK